MERRNPRPALHPENVEAVEAFLSLQTQWRVGPGGILGMDYAGVRAWLCLMRIPRARWPDLTWRIQVLEGAALDSYRSH